VAVVPLGRDGILSGIQGISPQFSLLLLLCPCRLTDPFGDRRSKKFSNEIDFVGFEIEGSHLMKQVATEYDMKRNLIVLVISKLMARVGSG